ncbi:MAG: TonB family protein [Sandaracinaceae bacterium]
MSTRQRPPAGGALLLPPALVLVAALVFSVGLHVPAYMGLGLLKVLLESPPPAPPPMQVEIVGAPTVPTDVAELEDEAEPPEEELEDEPLPETPDPASPEDEATEEPEPEEPEPEPTPAIPMPSATPPPPPPPEQNLTSVEHRSQDPDVEPPPDAQHLAEENSRVEEETMARIRNPNLNDPEPTPPAPSEPSEASEEEGDASEEEMAELDEAEGSDERDPTPEELEIAPPPRPREASRSPTPSTSEAAAGGEQGGGAPNPGQARVAAGGGRRAEGGGEVATREVVVTDGIGSYTIRVPLERPVGEGEGEGGGVAVLGRGQGREGEGRASGRAGRSGRRARGGARGGRGAPDLRVSWSQFSTIYGEEELEREREAFLERRRSRVRGMSSGERFRRFRAAIENYDVRVRPGNQTALNTRADPFAAYVASMHRRIHPRFALRFIPNLPATVDPVYRTNPTMHTKLELAIDAEGRVDHVSVMATSGDTMFDLGAFEAVMGAQPFSPTPENIRSPDGLVYVHWSFYRNQRQCGTFNAQMYILANAPTRRRGDSVLDRTTAAPARTEEE